MTAHQELAGRSYIPRVYRVARRGDLRAFVIDAIRRSGGQVLFASDATRAPLYLGVRGQGEERLGILCYPFRCNPPPIAGRAADEHRVQVRYGAEATWQELHPIARDLAGVDTTTVLGVHLEAGLMVGLDPLLYDPLPMGISVEFKDAEVTTARAEGWHVWERDNMAGRRRPQARSPAGLETLVALRPERLLDYVRMEREASELGLDPALRYTLAVRAGSHPANLVTPHVLEKQFALSSAEILEIIAHRSRLSVAVRGGVAEHHLARVLAEDPAVVESLLIEEDGKPDFEVRLHDGRRVLVECKNASPKPYPDGTFKVEVQKTRSSKSDPASRLYRPEQFEIVAACLYAATGRWTFRFAATHALPRDAHHRDRLAPLQRIDRAWHPRLLDAL